MASTFYSEEVEYFYFLALYELKPEHNSLGKFYGYHLETFCTNEPKFQPHTWAKANASTALNKQQMSANNFILISTVHCTRCTHLYLFSRKFS